MMKKYVYAVIMIIYIGLSIVVINYATNWLMKINYSIFASKARDIAKLTVKNFWLTDTEVEELLKLEFKDIVLHPANIRLADLFSDKEGYNDIKFVYIMTQLEGEQIKYLVTEEYKDFYDAQVGTPLNAVWLVDVNIGKTTEEVLAENKFYYDDVRRYSLLRYTNETAFRNKTATNAIVDDETGFLISALEPFYSQEGTFVGMVGVDIYIDEYQRIADRIRLLLLIMFLMPSGALTVVYILLYIVNVKKLLATAQTDPLTSIKNRRFMDKYLQQTIKEHYKKQLPLSVIMIDIDFFKKYNDTYGHQQGDKVLVDVTAAIASVLRDRIDFVCRYGGEEFLVILTNTKASNACEVAQRIKAKVNGLAIKHEHSNVCDVVTVSQGVYSAVPSSVASDKIFIEYADKGLYEAKNTGRNKYVMVEA